MNFSRKVITDGWKIGVGIVLLGALSLLLFRYFIAVQRGADTEEQVVAQYIAALRAKNADQIIALIPASHTITRKELDAIIAEAAAKDLRAVEVAYMPSEAGYIAIVDLHEAPDEGGAPGELIGRIYLQRQNERWYLSLGRARNGVPTDAPSTKVN
ncbi:MAG: hypothetical protein M3Q45_11375 [Chloroflexota bacterium]|nr:hypothetical protein [Chloroflexota bacterium]